MTIDKINLHAASKHSLDPLHQALKNMQGMKAGVALLYAMEIVMPLCMEHKENVLHKYAKTVKAEEKALNCINQILALLDEIKNGKDPELKDKNGNPIPWSDPRAYPDLVDPYGKVIHGHKKPKDPVEKWNPIYKIFTQLTNLFDDCSKFMSADQLKQFKDESGEFGKTWESFNEGNHTVAIYDLGKDLWNAWNTSNAQPVKNPYESSHTPSTDNGAALKTFQDDLNNLTTTVNGQQSSTQAELKVEMQEYSSLESAMKNLGQGIVNNQKPFINGVRQS